MDSLETPLEIFLVSVPGLEPVLHKEAIAAGFETAVLDKGGVTMHGSWEDVWRAHLDLRGPSRILVRVGSFRAMHLAQLDKRARKFDWRSYLRPDIPFRVEASCKKSRIYHQKAAAQRVEQAIKETLGAKPDSDADVCIKIRVADDLCTISLDVSGEGLHKRGTKQAVNKAPLRETMAALLLRHCGYFGKEPIVDPMCGSGTFPIEAAEIACSLQAGRSRNFAFEKLVTFDPAGFERLKKGKTEPVETIHLYGFDRDRGAIKMAQANAERSGVSDLCHFENQAISDLKRPEGATGLVIINPPYGTRIGEVKKLLPLYQSLGDVLLKNFSGWRVGLLTNNESLAKATGLPLNKRALSISHGGIPVKFYRTQDLP